MFQIFSVCLFLLLHGLSFAAALPPIVPGTLDTTFNPNGPNPGTLAIPFNNNLEASSSAGPNTALALQEDGKIVLAGTAVAEGLSYFGVARFNSDGSLDTTFNPNGAQPGTTILPLINNQGSECKAMALQSDGKIVVAGMASNGDNYCFALARLNSDGSLDITFNPNGTGSAYRGLVLTSVDISLPTTIYSIALQSDGKIVAVGEFNGNDGGGAAFARYNTDGSLDTTFGTEGITRLPRINGLPVKIYSIKIDPYDGSIVGAGYGNNNSGSCFLIARLTAQGERDTNFTAPGNSSDVLGIVLHTIDNDQYYNYAYALEIQPDRKIVVTGQIYDWYGIAVARLNPEGTLDTTFNPTGPQPGTGNYFINGSVYNYSGTTAIGLQKDGSIVVAGFGYPSETYQKTFAVVRIKPNGQIDSNFAPHATHPGSMMVFINNSTQRSEASSLTIQKNGAIVIGGFARVPVDGQFFPQSYFALARFNGGSSTITDPYALALRNNYSGT